MRHQSSPRRSAFTFVELLVVLAITLFGMAVLVGAAGNANDAKNRDTCKSNLRQIGTAMALYANDNHGSFPRLAYDPKHADTLHFYTAPDAKDPFAKDGPVNDVTAALFLLMRTQDIQPSAFICPSTTCEAIKFAGKTAQDFSNFPDNRNLSYSLHNPYFSEKALDNGARWSNTLKAEFALAADMNPGGDALTKLTSASPGAELRKGNSKNHSGDGQNVLFADGHVDFTTTPFCGIDDDNIFTFGPSGKTAGGAGIKGSPQSASDSVLLPTSEDGAAKK